MAMYRGAIPRTLPENTTQPRVRITQVILHIAASEGNSLENWWNHPGNNLESHFYIRYDGTVEQYIDTSRSADANYTANLRDDGTGALSIETEGLGDGRWTPAQLDSIQRLIDWAHEIHGVPLRVCRDANDPGIGYHVMFGAPGPWTTARGKVCPGPNRINQFRQVLAPRLGVVSDEGDDVSYDDAVRAVKDVLRMPNGLNVPQGQQNNGNFYVNVLGSAQANFNNVNAIRVGLGQVLTAVEDSAEVTGDDEAVITEAIQGVLDRLNELHPEEPEPEPAA